MILGFIYFILFERGGRAVLVFSFVVVVVLCFAFGSFCSDLFVFFKNIFVRLWVLLCSLILFCFFCLFVCGGGGGGGGEGGESLV